MNTTADTTESAATINFCNVDRLFYIYRNGEEIHAQQTKPNETELIEALKSDNWKQVFEEMKEGKRVRVSMRIYYDILGSVPPIRQTSKSFFCGEAYSGNLHHYFEREEDGKYYGQLKAVN